MERKNKYFTASDCIHLHACRKVTTIANRLLYGLKGTQKLVRGCSKECPCYSSAEELAESVESALGNLCDAISELSSNYDVFPNSDNYAYINSPILRAKSSIEEIEEFIDNIHNKDAETSNNT